VDRRSFPIHGDDEVSRHRILRIQELQLVVHIWRLGDGGVGYSTRHLDAFASVEYIMRDVEWGWLIRYMHSTGASFFFIVVYLHMFRAMLYGSYKKPRELIWIIGMLIFLVLMAEGFAGYLLPAQFQA